MNKTLKFHKVTHEHNKIYAYFRINKKLERKSFKDLKAFAINDETIKAYKAIVEFEYNLRNVLS